MVLVDDNDGNADDDDDNEEIVDDESSAIVEDEDAPPVSMINKLKSLLAEIISMKKPLTAINNNRIANITIKVQRIIIKNECRPIVFITLFGGPGNGLFGNVWPKGCLIDDDDPWESVADFFSHLFRGKH